MVVMHASSVGLGWPSYASATSLAIPKRVEKYPLLYREGVVFQGGVWTRS